MPMRDGTVLRADIYRPESEQKYPAILNRTPYNKATMVEYNNNFMQLLDAVQSGYAMVVQDVRGRFASEGVWNGGDPSFSQEGPDGYDSVEWLAGQTWCDGNVGLAGASQCGALQWISAENQPPHLKAMIFWVIGAPNGSQAVK
ncbi:MAG: CocE/NonD family hydrolase, partial [Dehalococcoidales bacterium]|nr:CocE/NonD family hydrolase [Dehalococcoidales bacterium]